MGTSLEHLLKQVVSISSTYPEEVRLQAFITSLFLKEGYQVKVQQVEGERANIIVEKGKGNRTILLYSHLDTVPVASGWSSAPHRARKEGDRLYGLGAFDMKGGMVVNMRTFLDYEPKNIKLRLLFAVDEEYVSKGGHVFASSPEMQNIDCVLSPEPAFANGVNGIVTGRIGRSVVIIRMKRSSQHSFYYEPGNDINLLSAAIILDLAKLYREENGKKEFAFSRAMRVESAGMSTPEEVVLEVDTSILPPHTPETMLRQVQAIARQAVGRRKDVSLEVFFKERATPFLSGYELGENNGYLTLMKNTIEQVTGEKAVPYFRSSVADENIFGAAGIPVLGVGPAGGNAHGANEWVSLSSLRLLERVYAAFLRSADGPSTDRGV